jgi:diketogulonate reductase-like aldo/keto reductase
MRQTSVRTPAGELTLPVIGLGTWTFGERPERRRAEIDALRLGFERGMTLVDTAELYGAGGAERVVGEAIADCRERVFVVTKVWPSHARADAVVRAVEGSLSRLRTPWVDAVLLHWPTRSVPVEETMRGFERVVAQGLARFVGASNFPATVMAQADAAAAAATPLVFHQVRYGLDERRAEHFAIADAASRGRVLLAYSPLGHGRLPRSPGWPVLRALAERRGVSPERLALAWVVAHPGVVALVKAGRPEHVEDDAAAAEVTLSEEERARLEAAFAVGRGDPPALGPQVDAFYRLVLWALARRFRHDAPR